MCGTRTQAPPAYALFFVDSPPALPSLCRRVCCWGVHLQRVGLVGGQACAKRARAYAAVGGCLGEWGNAQGGGREVMASTISKWCKQAPNTQAAAQMGKAACRQQHLRGLGCPAQQPAQQRQCSPCSTGACAHLPSSVRSCAQRASLHIEYACFLSLCIHAFHLVACTEPRLTQRLPYSLHIKACPTLSHMWTSGLQCTCVHMGACTHAHTC